MNKPWRISLHGGHSGAYCDHASGSLREILDAAIAAGFTTYGLTEHAPRLEERFLYAEEVAMGWDVAKIEADFHAYAEETRELVPEYAGRLTVLRGFEAEVVPSARYAEIMREYRERFGFDYIVGSVHYVDEISIDSTTESFEQAMEAAGGLEDLAVRYYETIAAMVQAIKPDVVGHLDQIRKLGHRYGALDTPAIRRAAGQALEVIRQAGAILDLNTGGYRKGLETPFPDVWLLALARDMSIPFCFGDDSHGPEQVGDGLDRARDYLLENGVTSITALTREGSGVGRVDVSFE